MTSSITEINSLIGIIERSMQIDPAIVNKGVSERQIYTDTIVTPDWVKDNEIETKDCSCDDKIKKNDFPFDASMSKDNFDKYISDNIDIIKENGNEFIKNLHDKREMNLLHCACINDCDELIEILISKYHININEVDIDGYSPLFYCVNQWSIDCVSKLLLFKPRLDLITKDCVIHATGFPIYICGGKTIFHTAAEINSVKCCQLILKYMKEFHSTKMIDILLQKDLNGMNAIDTAKMYNKIEMVQLFNEFIRNNMNNNTQKCILKLLNDNIPNEKERKNMKREYHLKVRERIKLNKHNKRKKEQMNISKYYKPKFSELFFRNTEFFPL
eukprot:347562_1